MHLESSVGRSWAGVGAELEWLFGWMGGGWWDLQVQEGREEKWEVRGGCLAMMGGIDDVGRRRVDGWLEGWSQRHGWADLRRGG